MAIDKILIKADGLVKDTIDFRQRVYTGLDSGDHLITIEGYLEDSLVTSSSVNVTVPVETLDPDYEAVIQYAIDNNIPVPSSEQQLIDNQILINYKATGAWDKDDIFFKFNGTAGSQFKRICWKRLIQIDAYGDLTWSDTGVKGNGFNAYLDTLYIPATDGVNLTLNNAGVTWNSVQNLAGQYALFGANENGIIWSIPNRNGSEYFSINGGYVENNGGTGDNWTTVGVAGLYRGNATEIVFDGVQQRVLASDSTTIPTNSMFIFRRNSATEWYSPEELSYFTMGASKIAEHSSIKTILV